MPEKSTIQRARRDRRAGKRATTQAGAFVGEEMRHVRRGKYGAKNRKQAIAIGLSKARRAGVKVPPKRRRATTRRAGPSTGSRRSPSVSAARGASRRKTTSRRRTAVRGASRPGRRTTRRTTRRRTTRRG
jgi:hypothetical protein